MNSKQKKNGNANPLLNKKKRYEYKYHHQDEQLGHSVPIYELENSNPSHGIEEEEPRFGINGNGNEGIGNYGGMREGTEGSTDGYQREGFGPASPGHLDGPQQHGHYHYHHGLVFI